MNLHPWAVIPEAQLEAAAGFGRLVAMGVMSWEECLDPLLKAAQANGYRGDEYGARCTLAYRVRDAATAWEIKRSKADVAIRRALAPFLRDRQAGRVILAVAAAENKRWDGALTSDEIVALVREEAAWWQRCNARSLSHAA